MTPEVLQLLANTMNNLSNKERKLFQYASFTEISNEDRSFICRMMKLDPRDRPTASELLQDEWFAALGMDDGSS